MTAHVLSHAASPLAATATHHDADRLVGRAPHLREPPVPQPLLTFVAATRNDNHGGRLIERTQAFLDALFAHCERTGVAAELIIVEWNPPGEVKRLREVQDWSRPRGRLDVRIVEVPASFHDRLHLADRLPFFQMIAKNVGIRRARGRFVVAANIDVIFSRALLDTLAQGPLDEERMYRADRVDVDSDIPRDASLDELLAYCDNHVIRIATREATIDTRGGQDHLVLPPLTLRRRATARLQGLGLLPVRNRARLHTNACGDFTMLSRRAWFALAGCPELELFSMHVDALLCLSAHHSGFKEQALPPPAVVFHIEHSTGSGWTPQADHILNDRLRSRGIDSLPHGLLDAWAIDMRQRKSGRLFNRPDWGRSGHPLSEWTLP